MKGECSHAADIGAAIAGGALSEREDLRAHLSACESCAQLAQVMLVLRADRDHARRHAQVPSAGLVWWRAQLRARREAEARATTPVTAVQAIAVVGGLVAAVGLASTIAATTGVGGEWLRNVLPALPSLPAWSDFAGPIAEISPWVQSGLVLSVTTWLVLAPVALYFAFRKD
jgi:hypothetical protein